MNKLVMPTMLLATIMIAGMFAFIPIENASTFHLLLNQGISGASSTETKSVSTDDVSSGDGINGIVHHNFILESDVPFTIHDITVKGEIDNSDTNDDVIRVAVRGYPGEYDLDPKAARNDNRLTQICDDCRGNDGTVISGDDEVTTQTWSMVAVDKTQSSGDLTFGPDTNIVVQICFDDDGSASDYSAEVTFYLRGIFSDDDVSLTLVEGSTVDDDDNGQLGCQFAE